MIRDLLVVRELVEVSWDGHRGAAEQGNDWDRAAVGCRTAYDFWITRWADGTDVRTANLEPAHLAWLEKPGLSIGFDEGSWRSCGSRGPGKARPAQQPR